MVSRAKPRHTCSKGLTPLAPQTNPVPTSHLYPTPGPTLTANQLKGNQEWRVPLLPIFGAPVPLKSWFSLGPTSFSVLFHLLPPASPGLPIPTSQSHPHPSSPGAGSLASPAFLT